MTDVSDWKSDTKRCCIHARSLFGSGPLRRKRTIEQKNWTEKIVEVVVPNVSRDVDVPLSTFRTSPHIGFVSMMPVAYEQIKASGTNTFGWSLRSATVCEEGPRPVSSQMLS